MIRTILMLLALLAAIPAAAEELWVVNRGTLAVEIIDTATNASVATIDVSDPDLDSLPDPPRGLAFSTLNGHPGTKAFVSQGRLLTVLDVATRTIQTTHDLALAGLAGIELRGCAASRPRTFFAPVFGAPIVQTYLHCAATSSSGDALYVVLDQSILVSSGAGGNPVVTSGTLVPNASGYDVKVLNGPSGSRHHRAWYTAVRTSPDVELFAVSVYKGPSFFDTWNKEIGHGQVLAAATIPDVLQIGAPPETDFPVMPGASSGVLTNLDLGGQCQIAGDIPVVSISGPGRFSYTVLALDQSTNELLEITPEDCTVERVTVGLHPLSITPLSTMDPQSVFVANRDSGTITRIYADGSPAVTIALTGPNPTPVSSGMAGLFACHVEYDGDVYPVGQDLRVDWSTAGICPSMTRFDVYCRCGAGSIGDPDCPCFCDCDLPQDRQDPDCICSDFEGIMGASATGLNVGLIPDAPVEGKNPWKRLGISIPDTFWDHENEADSPHSTDYGVGLTGSGPPP